MQMFLEDFNCLVFNGFLKRKGLINHEVRFNGGLYELVNNFNNEILLASLSRDLIAEKIAEIVGIELK